MPALPPFSSRPPWRALACLLLYLGAPPFSAAQSQTRVDLGLSAPIDDIDSVGQFSAEMSRNLVWTLRSNGGETAPVRLNIVRLDRGRVTASRQTGGTVAGHTTQRVAEAMDAADWSAMFLDCCLRTDDPPVRITALSGPIYLDIGALEGAVAAVARDGVIGKEFGLREETKISWGRQFVLIISVSASPAIDTRPLILLVERV